MSKNVLLLFKYDLAKLKRIIPILNQLTFYLITRKHMNNHFYVSFVADNLQTGSNFDTIFNVVHSCNVKLVVGCLHSVFGAKMSVIYFSNIKNSPTFRADLRNADNRLPLCTRDGRRLYI